MKHYFIDYENVHGEGLNGIESLEPDSDVRILYSENCKNISLEIIERASENKIELVAYKAVTGKNALDFQLSSLLGYIIGTTERKEDTYFIVSKDTGFDAVVEFWKKQGVMVSRICSLDGKVTPEPAEQAVTTAKATVKKKTATAILQTTKEELLKYLSENEYSDDILNVINSYKTRIAINNGFTHLFKDTGKAGVVYNKIKPLLKEKGKS